MVLIGGSSVWFKPVNLAWYDTNLAYTTRFEATGQSGVRYKLSPDYFAPYQYPFTLGNFSYLVDRPHLGTVWGASGNAKIVEALRAAKDLDQVREIESVLGKNHFDADRVVIFDRFVRRFTTNLNQRSVRGVLPGWLDAPPQLWTFSPENTFQAQEEIREISVYLVTSLFSGGRYAEIDKEFLGVVYIPVPGDSAGFQDSLLLSHGN